MDGGLTAHVAISPDFFALISIRHHMAVSFRQPDESERLVLPEPGIMAAAAASDRKKIVPRCGIQLSLVTPSCHQILLCSGQGEQSGGERWGLVWGGRCRFLANAQACWRQGGVLITGCMHFVKCRTINLGNYPSIPHPPALLYLPSLLMRS